MMIIYELSMPGGRKYVPISSCIQRILLTMLQLLDEINLLAKNGVPTSFEIDGQLLNALY
jgi:hypothetical protein